MLIGTYRHSLDSKNRMRIPSKFKNELGANCIITKGTGSSLMVFSSEGFQNLYERLSSISIFDEEAQKPVRKFLSSAFDAEEDAQGRILLPKELVKHASITKNVVFVGVGNRVEIWAEEIWDKMQEENDEKVDFSVLAKLGV